MANDDKTQTTTVDQKSVEEIAISMAKVKKESKEVTSALNEQLKIITQLRDVMAEYTKNTEAAASGMNNLTPEKFTMLTKKVDEMNKSTKGTTSTIKTLGDKMKIFTKGSAIALGAVTGLFQGFKNLVAIGKGTTSLIMSIADGLFSIGKSIFAIPFKMMSALFNMATSGGGDTSLFEAIEKVREEFGSLRSESSRAVLDVARSMGKLDNTGVSAFRIFGNLAQRIEAVLELAKGMGASFEVFQEEIAHNGEAIMRYQRGLGITNEQMSGIASTALRMGKDVAKIQNEMTKQAMGMSKAFGVNAKVISKDMAKAMADLAHFGHLSTKELGIAATFANKLGVSVDKLTGIMDATKTYDQTVESMSKLNEQFGLNIDYTQMMMAENPAEQVEILRKEFARTGKDMSTMSRFQRDLIKSSTGLTDETLNASFAMKSRGVALDKMNKQGDKNEKKTLSQTDAMKELADSIKRLTPPSGSQKPSIIDQIVDGFMRGLQTMPEFIKLMRNIRWILAESYLFGIKLGRMFNQLFPGVKEIVGGLAELFDPKHFRGAFTAIVNAFNIFKVKGIDGMSDFMVRLKEVFFNFFNKETGPGKKVIEGFKKFGETIVKVVLEIGKVAWSELKNLYSKVIEELKNPSETTKAFKTFLMTLSKNVGNFIKTSFVPVAKEVMQTITRFFKKPSDIPGIIPKKNEIVQFLSDIFGPVGSALVDAAKALWPDIKELVSVLVSYLGKALWEGFKAMPWEAQLAIIGIMWGPAITRTLAAMGAEVALRSGMDLLKNAWKKQLGKTLAEGATEAAGSSTVKQAGSTATETMGKTLGSGMKAAFPTFTAGFSSIGTALTSAVTLSVGAVLSVVGAALVGLFAGWKIGEWLYDSAKEKSVEITKAYDAGINTIVEENDPKKKISLINDQLEKARKDLKEQKDRGFVSSTWDMMFGTGDDNLRAAQAAVDQLESSQKYALKEREKLDRSFMKGTVEYEKRMAEESKKKQLESLGPVTIENAAERFKKVDELAKKMMSKDFDIKGKLAMIKEKIESIGDFSIIGAKQEEQLNKTVVTIESIRGLMGAISDIGIHIERATSSLKKIDKVAIENNMNHLNEAIHVIGYSTAFHPGNMTIQEFNGVSEQAAKNSERLIRLFEYFTPVVEKLTAIKDIMNKLQGVVNVNPIADTLSAVFLISDMYAGFQLDTSGITNVNKALSVLGEGVQRLAQIHTSMADVAKTVTGKGMKQTMTAVSDMIKKTQELDDSLAKMPNFSFPARLSALASGMGLGGKFAYTVQSKNVVINMSIEVKMDAGEVESVIVHRSKSIIRDRLNYALGDGRGADKTQAGVSLPILPGNDQMIAGTVL